MIEDDDHTLAQHGGRPVRSTVFPTNRDATGHRFGHEEREAVLRVLDSGMLNSTVGPETRALEGEFAAMLGVRHAIASSSGTAALHLAVAAVDPEPGGEIITTPLSDGGTLLPILAQNAVPVFADVDPRTGNLDPLSVAALITSRTVAILAVHLFGVPADLATLREVADQHGLYLIEDCAQAYLTETAEGAMAGTVGDLACFSLQQSKHITAGDGGLTVTGDPAFARRAALFADKAWPRDTDERTHLFLGLNYRMTELQAAVARAQLPKLSSIVADRRRTAAELYTAVSDLDGLKPPPFVEGSSYFLLPFYMDPDALASGPDYALALNAEGIPAIPGYLQHPLNDTPVLTARRTYGNSGFPFGSPYAAERRYGLGICPVAERMVTADLLVLAWNENYTDRDVADIARAIRKVHRHFSAAG